MRASVCVCVCVCVCMCVCVSHAIVKGRCAVVWCTVAVSTKHMLVP